MNSSSRMAATIRSGHLSYRLYMCGVMERIAKRLEKLPVWQKTHNACHYVYSNGLAAFTIHPAEGQETYLEHLWFALKISLRLMVLGIIMLTHGIFPFLFTRTVSGKIEQVYLIMRSRIPQTRRMIIDNEYDI